MKAKNIKGTSDNTCNCDSWLDHWKSFGGGSLPAYCSSIGCSGKPEAGAHVQKESDNNWYIIPLCNSCNKLSDSLDVSDATIFVSANTSETCA